MQLKLTEDDFDGASDEAKSEWLDELYNEGIAYDAYESIGDYIKNDLDQYTFYDYLVVEEPVDGYDASYVSKATWDSASDEKDGTLYDDGSGKGLFVNPDTYKVCDEGDAGAIEVKACYIVNAENGSFAIGDSANMITTATNTAVEPTDSRTISVTKKWNEKDKSVTHDSVDLKVFQGTVWTPVSYKVAGSEDEPSTDFSTAPADLSLERETDSALALYSTVTVTSSDDWTKAITGLPNTVLSSGSEATLSDTVYAADDSGNYENYTVTYKKTYVYYVAEEAQSGYRTYYALGTDPLSSEVAVYKTTTSSIVNGEVSSNDSYSLSKSDGATQLAAVKIPNQSETSLTVINTAEGLHDVSKQWAGDGTPSDSVTVHVYRRVNAEAYAKFAEAAQVEDSLDNTNLSTSWALYGSSYTLSGSNNWYAAFDLPGVPTVAEMGNNAGGGYSPASYEGTCNVFDYAIVEESVEGYLAHYTVTQLLEAGEAGAALTATTDLKVDASSGAVLGAGDNRVSSTP